MGGQISESQIPNSTGSSISVAAMSVEELEFNIGKVEHMISVQAQKHSELMKKQLEELSILKNKFATCQRNREALSHSQPSAASDTFVRRVEWKISDLKDKLEKTPSGESFWSDEFTCMGIKGLQLEFFPKGRESTTLPGFCSLFLWCPAGTKIKYQLWAGNHICAPDEDAYDGRMGHGHSNFCKLDSEINTQTDSITVGVSILEIHRSEELESGLRIITTPPECLISKEADLLKNWNVTKVEWKIGDIRRHMRNVPVGSSLCSPLFCASGIREIFLEFYPNGIPATTKEGFCAFYIRCPEGTVVTVTLFVGEYRKGPIQTQFDGTAGKGLPEFCKLEEQIENDEIRVGIEIHKNPKQLNDANTIVIEYL